LLNASKYGVWSFHHADNSINRGGPAGFWEIIYKQPSGWSYITTINA